jgi:large subunit ribosomal protein L10
LRPNQEAKRAVIDELKSKLSKAKAFVLVDYKGLTVENDTVLRKAYREAKVEYGVHKNTLMRIALNELGFNQFDKALNGPTAIAISYEDEVIAAKVSKDSADKFNTVQIKCGFLDGNFVDAKGVEAIAQIPSKPVLLGMLANVLNAPIQGLAIALKAIADKQEA